MDEKARKVRINFSKNRVNRRREVDLTREFHRGEQRLDEDMGVSERIRAKGDLTRKRTVQVNESGQLVSGQHADTLRGQVILSQGLQCVVAAADGEVYRCYIRRLIKSFARDERNVVVTGDWVDFRPAPDNEGMVLAVDPRRRVLTRRYRHREHIIAANIDQILIVSALAEPMLKPGLIDRYLLAAERNGIKPIICFNKADLVDASLAQPILGLYSQIGYCVVLTSASTGRGVDQLRRQLIGSTTALVGQSGVGKSSLLNALEPRYRLRVNAVSSFNQKGKHTTTNAQLLQMTEGGVLIDTPGIRQFDLWDINPAEVQSMFPEFRPFAAMCRFPRCTHLHENDCGVKQALADYLVHLGRYESYLKIVTGDGGAEIGD